MAADRSGVGDHGIVLQRAREMGIYALPWPFFFPPLSFPSATLLRYPRYVRLSRQLFPSFFRAFVSSLRFFFLFWPGASDACAATNVPSTSCWKVYKLWKASARTPSLPFRFPGGFGRAFVLSSQPRPWRLYFFPSFLFPETALGQAKCCLSWELILAALPVGGGSCVANSPEFSNAQMKYVGSRYAFRKHRPFALY